MSPSKTGQKSKKPAPRKKSLPKVKTAPAKGAPGVDGKLLEMLVCPLSKLPLEYDSDAQELISERAGLAYPIRNGIPIMLVDEARKIDD